MNILLSFQSFSCESLYKEIVKFSVREDIERIFLVSSLMHDVDQKTIDKFDKLVKVNVISSNTLFSFQSLCQVKFNLSKDFIGEGQDIYTTLLSSSRWLPVTEKIKNDYISFSMINYYDICNFWNIFFGENSIDSVILLNAEHSAQDKILIDSASQNEVQNIITATITGAFAKEGKEFFSFFNNVSKEYINLLEYKNKDKSQSELNGESDFKLFSKNYETSLVSEIRFACGRLLLICLNTTSFFIKLRMLFNKVSRWVWSRVLLRKRLKYIKKLRKFYEHTSISDIDYDKKYIYYCLHFDPEAATLPIDNSYSNQLLNLRILASSIPNDWNVYVKEHPHQLQYELYKDILLNQLHSVDGFRSETFYKYISSLNNVKLISLSSEHKLIMQNAEFIVSNTGTVFREASYMHKKCITFSKRSLYSLLDNVFSVSDVQSCQKVINNNCKVVGNDVNKVFNDYSITIKDLNKSDSELFEFISKSNIFLR